MGYYLKPSLQIVVLYSSQKNIENPPHLSAYQLPSPCVPSTSPTKCHIYSRTLSISLSAFLVCYLCWLVICVDREAVYSADNTGEQLPCTNSHRTCSFFLWPDWELLQYLISISAPVSVYNLQCTIWNSALFVNLNRSVCYLVTLWYTVRVVTFDRAFTIHWNWNLVTI